MLLNKHNLAVADFADGSKDPRPVLAALYVTPTHTVATDCYKLVEVENVKADPKDLPAGLTSDDRPVLIPVASVKKVEKLVPKSDAFPILQNVATSVNEKGDTVTLSTTDLESVNKIESRAVQGNYPDYHKVFPEGEPITRIRVNAEYLREVVAYFAKHGHELPDVTLELYGPEKPLVLRGKTEAGQAVRAMVMPLRMPS